MGSRMQDKVGIPNKTNLSLMQAEKSNDHHNTLKSAEQTIQNASQLRNLSHSACIGHAHARAGHADVYCVPKYGSTREERMCTGYKATTPQALRSINNRGYMRAR